MARTIQEIAQYYDRLYDLPTNLIGTPEGEKRLKLVDKMFDSGLIPFNFKRERDQDELETFNLKNFQKPKLGTNIFGAGTLTAEERADPNLNSEARKKLRRQQMNLFGTIMDDGLRYGR